MKEVDYIRATNVARAKIALEIVRDIMPGFDGVVTEEDHTKVRKILSGWTDGLFAAITDREGEQSTSASNPSITTPKAGIEVTYGNGKTEYGPGVNINLTGEEVANAINAWLLTHGVSINGPRTTTVNGVRCEVGQVYVDPSGLVIADGEKFSGRGAQN